jgi:UDP-N-acetylmuramyl tripeptide synthase
MFYLIIWISKLLGAMSRLLGKGGGSALPGLFAEQADDEILTTTTKMIQEILEQVGYKVITNGSGSNLSRGIISTLVDNISWRGRFEPEIGLFEVDEASMPAVCKALRPQAVLILNLFRDQLDRYGELDTTAKLLGSAIEGLDTQVYLNADDPLVASLARYVTGPSAQVHFYGVEEAKTHKLAHDLAADSDHCPACGHPLDYSLNFFGHIGHYKCPNKDFARPTPETKITSFEPGKAFELARGHEKAKLYLPLPGLYNAYNALAAVALLAGMGISLERATGPLERATAAFGRVERLEVDGREVYLLLIKNPTGFNQVIQTFLVGEKSHSVMIAINDNFADGRDVSWLWDVAFEEMAGHKHQITASGIRATDLALRLKYADQQTTIQENLEVAFNHAVGSALPGETVYILPTYTAMLQLRERIRSRGLVAGRWT